MIPRHRHLDMGVDRFSIVDRSDWLFETRTVRRLGRIDFTGMRRLI